MISPQYGIATSKSFPYISPGLRIGWNFGRGLTISPKISFGINTDYNLGDDMKYYNLTIGFKAPLFRKAKYSYETHKFIEFQAGYTPIPENGLFLGGGLGFMFYKDDKKTKFRPMATIDFGWLIFLAFDFVFIEKKKISTDFGLLDIFPIPLSKWESGFN